MKKMSLLIIFLLLSMLSCGPDHKDQEVKELYDEVIKIHDDVMPKISDISQLRRKLQKSENLDHLSKGLISQLESADDGMMSWMSDFQVYKTYRDSSKESKIKFLNNEKIKIQLVSNNMKNIIKATKEYLNE